MRGPAKPIQGGSTPSGTFLIYSTITLPAIQGCKVQK